MSSHDSFLANIWKKWPHKLWQPEVIARAMLLRLLEEGRITSQEFQVIDDGIGSLWERLKSHQARRKAKEVRP